tara:strand:- start:2704 stop:3261 length:558 start_codon:yes stop_codon:yes gene_type:complete
MAYKPNKDTVSILQELYELEGSYAGVSRRLNKGRSVKDFTPRQVAKMLNRENVGASGGGYSKVNKPKGVRLSNAQQRSLQRKSKRPSGTYKTVFKESKAPNAIYDSIKRNIKNKRNRIQEEIRDLMQQKKKNLKAKQNTKAIDSKIESLREKVKGLYQFDENLDNAAKTAKDLGSWKNIQDQRTP